MTYQVLTQAALLSAILIASGQPTSARQKATPIDPYAVLR